MGKTTRQLELAEADLLGYEPKELLCNQCAGAFCGMRTARVYRGKALVMCGRKDEVREVLANIPRR